MKRSTSVFLRFAAVTAALSSCAFAAAQGANDCASAQSTKGYGTYPFSNVGSTTDGLADVLCTFFGNQQIFNDVWFTFTAPESTIVDVSTCAQSTLDTKIAIYGGTDCASPVIACSDDNCSLQTKVSFSATAGQSYLIRMGAYGATNFGSGTMTIGPIAFLHEATDKSTGIRYVSLIGTTWTSSEALAVSLGGHLASINDQAEQDFVLSNFGNIAGVDRRLWIGFTDFGSEGAFYWSDGSSAKYTNWNPGEPNNSGAVEHYAEMLGSNGKWNDLNDAGAGYVHVAVIELPGGGSTPCPADLDLDGNVGAADLATMLAYWGTDLADVTGDGTVDAADITILLSAWGVCP